MLFYLFYFWRQDLDEWIIKKGFAFLSNLTLNKVNVNCTQMIISWVLFYLVYLNLRSNKKKNAIVYEGKNN